MKVAIIGATGMIGHHTAKAVLNNGHELTVVHRAGSDLSKIQDLKFSAKEGDLSDSHSLVSALSGLDAVINCAAYYPTLPRPWQQEVKTATEQMEHFYHAVEQTNLKQAVYLGGAIALRKHPQGKAGNETLSYDSPPTNKNAYLQVKWAMDSQAIEKSKQGLPIVIGIPTMTFGEFDFGPTTGTLLSQVANRTLPAYVRGNRNVVYAGDAGRGLVLALEKGRSGERYLFTGENLSMDELILKMANLAQVNAPKALPLFVAQAAGKLQAMHYHYFNAAAPTISETAIAVMSGGQFIDGSKAKRELGYEPEVSVDEALRRAYAWFQQVGYVEAGF